MKITDKTPSPVYIRSRVILVKIGNLFTFHDMVYMRISDDIETDSVRAIRMASGEIIYFDSDEIVTHANGELIYWLRSRDDKKLQDDESPFE